MTHSKIVISKPQHGTFALHNPNAYLTQAATLPNPSYIIVQILLIHTHHQSIIERVCRSYWENTTVTNGFINGDDTRFAPDEGKQEQTTANTRVLQGLFRREKKNYFISRALYKVPYYLMRYCRAYAMRDFRGCGTMLWAREWKNAVWVYKHAKAILHHFILFLYTIKTGYYK